MGKSRTLKAELIQFGAVVMITDLGVRYAESKQVTQWVRLAVDTLTALNTPVKPQGFNAGEKTPSQSTNIVIDKDRDSRLSTRKQKLAETTAAAAQAAVATATSAGCSSVAFFNNIIFCCPFSLF
jgi:hypothetical protein